jgi:hypothetical protein
VKQAKNLVPVKVLVLEAEIAQAMGREDPAAALILNRKKKPSLNLQSPQNNTNLDSLLKEK